MMELLPQFLVAEMGHYVVDYMEAVTYVTALRPSQHLTGKLCQQSTHHCWKVISVDVMMEVPLSQDYNALMVAVDCLSK